MAGKVAYRKAFAALPRAEYQKSLVRETMEMHAGRGTIMELRRLTCKLVDNDVQVAEDLFPTEEAEYDEERFEEDESDINAIKGIRKKK